MNTISNTSGQGILLTTKLYIPPARPDSIPRPRLFAVLDEGVKQKLILISAAAGFGKTALVSEWIVARKALVAWVSLDKSDNDPTLFWCYVVASLKAVQPDIEKHILPLLHALQPPPIEAILTVLINTITTVSQSFVLVLDDYQHIETQTIHNALAFLLDHMPPQMHIIIATRTESPLPLARLRVSGQLTDLSTHDLRFTEEETTLFLTRVAELHLSSAHIRALATRTEGWIAGLQLAVLSMRGHDNKDSFIIAFTGSNQYILDYLIEEVLSQQPEHIQSFLLQTAILEQLDDSLCNALTGHNDGQEMLERLEEANLFLIPLDNQHSWYRYHRLFAEAMRQRLQKRQPDHLSVLYQRASAWYEHHGFITEAVNAMLAGQQYESVVRLIKQVSAPMMRRGETATLLHWLQELPDGVIRSHIHLCITYAWSLYITVQFDAAEMYITQAEHLLDALTDVPLQQGSSREAFSEIFALRAVIAVSRQDITHAIEFAQQAVQQLPKEKNAERALATWALGVAYWFNDDVEKASRAVTESIALGLRTDSPYAVLNAFSDLVQLQFAQGQLHQAEQTCQQGRQFIASHREQLPATNSIHIALGELERERNHLDSALDYLTQGLGQDQQIWNLGSSLRGYIALTRTKQAQGDAAGARETIQKAEQLVLQSHMPHIVAIIRAYQARLWLMQGNIVEAISWAQHSNLQSVDQFHHTREVEYLTLVRVYLAQQKSEEALHLLTRLLNAAEQGRRMGSVIEILALFSLTKQQQGATSEAITLLARSLSLAEPEGYVRIFVDEGASMMLLLNYLLERQQKGYKSENPTLGYTKNLLVAFTGEKYMSSINAQKTSQPLIEPLSNRELEVLRLIADGASNREIAECLIVSLGTVKKHINNIFGKLGVNSRTQAVMQARGLGILP